MNRIFMCWTTCAFLFVSVGGLVSSPQLKNVGVLKIRDRATNYERRFDSVTLRGKPWHSSRTSASVLEAQAQALIETDMTTEEDRVRDVCVAILLQVANIEDTMEKVNYKMEGSTEMDYNGFCTLVDTLSVPCTEDDKKTIFTMIDDDGGGSIDAKEIKKAVRSSGVLDSDRVRTVCIALLGQIDKAAEAVEDGSVDNDLDFNGFSALIDELKISCSEQDKKVIFAMIDEDGGGSICTTEIKEAVRSSGAVSKMYDDSVKTFGLLIAGTLLFDSGIYLTRGATDAFDFFTAYAVEDSLSVDNLFVFLLIFRYFKVPPQLVDICLNYGIAGSILLRGVFIYAGLAAANAFAPLNLAFAGFLLFSSYQILAEGEEDEEEDELPEVILKILDSLPLTGTFEGKKFFVNGDNGSLMATQLTATLVTIALCDVLFAVDSIPAVLAINEDPFIVYTSNICAVVGLRSLYQLLSVAVSDLVYLEKAVAIVLGFVGLKLAAEVAGVEVSSAISLTVIIASLSGGIVLSKFADGDTKTKYQRTPVSNFLVLTRRLRRKIGDAFEEL